MIKNTCKDCIHQDLCKFRKEYEALLEKLDNTEAEYEWLTTDYSCDYYKKDPCIDEDGNMVKGPIVGETTTTDVPGDNNYIVFADECPCNKCPNSKDGIHSCSCVSYINWLNRHNPIITTNGSQEYALNYDPCKDCLVNKGCYHSVVNPCDCCPNRKLGRISPTWTSTCSTATTKTINNEKEKKENE